MDLKTSLAIESWFLYALGVIIIACRLLSRRITLGKWKSLMIDDYLMLFAFVNFTGTVVCINDVAKNGSNYSAPEHVAKLTPEGTRKAVHGSIMLFVLELFTLTSTWAIKGCLLFLYARLMRNAVVAQHMLLKITVAYCVLTYLVVTLMFVFYWCRPTYEYWAVPAQPGQCSTYHYHMIFATACNVSSDMLLFCIPIPIIVKTRLPMKRKIILCCILGLGVFNILTAILNRYYNFTLPHSYVFLYWYVAEVGVAILVGNLPLCWPVVRIILGRKGASSGAASHYGETNSNERSKGRRVTQHNVDAVRDSRNPSSGSGSDQGSQIELVLQNPEWRPVCVAGSTEGDSDDGRFGTRGDKIRVVTTVETSSESQ